MTRAGVSDKDIWEYSVGTRALLRMQLKSLRLVWNIWCHLAYILDNWVRWLPIFPCYICSWWPNNYQGIRFWLGRRSNLKLRYMLACTDEEFNKKVEAIVKRCQRFEAGLLEGISLIHRQLMTLWRLRSFLKVSQHSNSIRLKSILLALYDWVSR